MKKEIICSWCGQKVDEQAGYQVSDTYNKVLCDACSFMVTIDNFVSDICCNFDHPEVITSTACVIEEDGSITKYKMTITKVV